MNTKPKQHKVVSNAKVNLALRITGRLDNGYHTISTLFQEIDFHDDLIFMESQSPEFTANIPGLPLDDDNLCIAAYNKLKPLRKIDCEFSVHLEKRIFMGAGLGGGSSNAAAVLKFLNQAWKIGLNDKELEKIGLDLGCDVPFFIKGGTQGGNHLGEELQPLDFPLDYALLLVNPGIHISTPWAYKKFSLTNKKNNYKFAGLLNNNVVQWQMFENQFEKVVFQSYPEIGEIKSRLLKREALYSGLSGSGSTMVGIFEDKTQAENAAGDFENYSTITSLPVR
ncbi:MAG: 4-(cytidine 5'-diphospho)-2-C-methyl-D-erythritol kinase [Fidelibacterota bacterium]